MQISSKFTIAVHALLLIDLFANERKVTSLFIASSVCVHPVIIRRTLADLKHAGLITVQAGTGGASLAKPAWEITLFDIYQASESAEKNLFGFHGQPNPLCVVGKNIHAILDGHLIEAQQVFEDNLKTTTLAELQQEAERYITEEKE